MKPKSNIKYVNALSDYSKVVLKEIPNGVLERLCKLTTMTEERKRMKVEEIYPVHIEKLRKAKLLIECPTFEEVEKNMKSMARKSKKEEREKDYKDKRNFFFCITHSKLWPMPISKIMQRIKDRHNIKQELNWLRCRISKYVSPNLAVLLNGVLVKKLNQGWKCLKTRSGDCD